MPDYFINIRKIISYSQDVQEVQRFVNAEVYNLIKLLFAMQLSVDYRRPFVPMTNEFASVVTLKANKFFLDNEYLCNIVAIYRLLA